MTTAFGETAQRMALLELEIDQKANAAETSLENRQRLQNWKRHKARQLAHIDLKVRDHQRVGTMDVEGMAREIQRKRALVEELKEERRIEEEVVMQATANCTDRIDGLQK